jgi:hypothetical protein
MRNDSTASSYWLVGWLVGWLVNSYERVTQRDQCVCHGINTYHNIPALTAAALHSAHCQFYFSPDTGCHFAAVRIDAPVLTLQYSVKERCSITFQNVGNLCHFDCLQ